MKTRRALFLMFLLAAPAFAAPAPKPTPAPKAAKDKPTPAVAAKPVVNRADPLRPMHMPFDPKLIVYPYEANYTYPIRAKLDTYTHIQLQEGERIVGFYLSDTLRWKHKVSITKQDLLVKPMAENLATTAALITSRRRYQLSFVTVGEDEEWHQRVSWNVGSDFEDAPRREPSIPLDAPVDLADGPVYLTQASTAAAPGQAQKPSLQPPPTAAPQQAEPSAGADSLMVRPENLNFDYRIEGATEFRPSQVFDDGRYTWFMFPQGIDLPVPFALSASGEAEIAQFLPKGGYHIIQQPIPYGAVLKLKREEVRILPGQPRKSPDCGGWFKPGCKPQAGNIVSE